MTTETKKQPKQKPAFYIFVKDADGKTTNIGAAFRHKKGNGMNIVIGQDYFVAFPPKAKSEATEEGA